MATISPSITNHTVQVANTKDILFSLAKQELGDKVPDHLLCKYILEMSQLRKDATRIDALSDQTQICGTTRAVREQVKALPKTPPEVTGILADPLIDNTKKNEEKYIALVKETHANQNTIREEFINVAKDISTAPAPETIAASAPIKARIQNAEKKRKENTLKIDEAEREWRSIQPRIQDLYEKFYRALPPKKQTEYTKPEDLSKTVTHTQYTLE